MEFHLEQTRLLSDVLLRSALCASETAGQFAAGRAFLTPKRALRSLRVVVLGTVFLAGGPLVVVLHAAQVPVRYPQGSQHGFLALRTLEGVRIATGDVTQEVHGDVVTSRLIFHFRDGSIDEDTTVFSQRKVFRLISDHHIQRGPSFPKPTDMFIDALHGLTTSRDGNGKVRQDHLDLPADLANGLPPNLLLNILPSVAETDISYLLPTNKPRLIHVSIKRAGMVPFSIGGTRRKAIDYVLHIELGGLTGVIAPLVGKEPADFHIWILSGAPPAFIREEGQLYEGGPIWRIEQISPTFSH
jgi:hypothetical protein